MKRRLSIPGMNAPAHFPDSRIGASLKQSVHALVVIGAVDFPDSRIGASLKQGAYPLQEAGPLHFPDSRIGASLKLIDRRPGEVLGDTSPIRESGPH